MNFGTANEIRNKQLWIQITTAIIFLNVKRTRTPGLKMAAVKIQHENCLQSTLRKKIINTLFAGLGRSVLGKSVPLVLGTARGLRPRGVLKTSGTIFPTSQVKGKRACPII